MKNICKWRHNNNQKVIEEGIKMLKMEQKATIVDNEINKTQGNMQGFNV